VAQADEEFKRQDPARCATLLRFSRGGCVIGRSLTTEYPANGSFYLIHKFST